jgi:hypothetical protein
MTRLAAFCLAAALLLPGAAFAQTSLTAYDAVRAALRTIWDELPLTARAVNLTEGPAGGYGQYTPREGSSFMPGETINVYVELLGYDSAPLPDGRVARRLAADLQLLDASGALRASQAGFYENETVSAEPLFETWLSFTATLGDFEPGDYRLRYVVRDLAGGEETSFEVPISLAPAAP